MSCPAQIHHTDYVLPGIISMVARFEPSRRNLVIRGCGNVSHRYTSWHSYGYDDLKEDIREALAWKDTHRIKPGLDCIRDAGLSQLEILDLVCLIAEHSGFEIDSTIINAAIANGSFTVYDIWHSMGKV